MVIYRCNNPETSEENNAKPIINYNQIPGTKHLTKEIEKDPENDQLYFARSKVFLKKKHFELAVKDLRKAISIDSSKTIYYFTLSDIYYLNDDISNAILILENGLSANKGDINLMLQLARLHLYIKKHIISINLINDILTLDVFHPEAYFLKGMNYKELGDTTKAVSSMQTAVEQDPDYYDAYMQLGIMLSAKKDKLALLYLDNAIRIDSNSVEAYYAKAMYYQETFNFQSAIETYKKLILINPQYERAYYNLGYIYFKNDSTTIAFKYFDMALKVAPTYSKAYYMRGLCAEVQGNFIQAKNDYNQTLKLHANYKAAQEGLKRIASMSEK